MRSQKYAFFLKKERYWFFELIGSQFLMKLVLQTLLSETILNHEIRSFFTADEFC